MMKSRTRQDKSVHEGYRHADINSRREGAQHPTGLRAVDVKLVNNTRIAGGDHDRSAFESETDVANESLVKDSINSLTLVVAALGQALQAIDCRLVTPQVL